MLNINHYVTFLKESFGFALSTLFSLLSAFVSVMMIGKLGPNYLAASTYILVFQSAVITILHGVIFAVGILIANRFGEKNIDGLRKVFSGGIQISIFLFLIALVILLNVSNILLFFGYSHQLVAFVRQFFNAYAFALLPIFLVGTLTQLLVATGESHVNVLFMLLNAALTVLFAWIFLFGIQGVLQPMQFFGYGVAISLAYWLTLFAMVLYLKWHKRFASLLSLNLLALNAKMQIKYIFSIGLPIGLELGIEQIAIILIVMAVGIYGIHALAILQATNQFMIIFISIVYSMAHVGATLIGRQYETHHYLDSHKNGGYVLKTVFVLAAILSFAFLIFPYALVSLFITPSKDIMHEIRWLFFFQAFVLLFDSLRHALAGALRGYADTKVAMQVSVLSAILTAIVCVLTVKLHLSMSVIFIGRIMTLLLCDVWLYCRWIRIHKFILQKLNKAELKVPYLELLKGFK